MRKPIISRNMTVTVCTVLCASKKDDTVFTKTVEVPRKHKKPEKLLKIVKSFVESEDNDTVVCYIKSSEIKQKLYAMPEETFLRYATEIASRSADDVAILFQKGEEDDDDEEEEDDDDDDDANIDDEI